MPRHSDDEALQKAVTEVEAAETELRRMKETLMPRDRADALHELMRAKLSAPISRKATRFTPAGDHGSRGAFRDDGDGRSDSRGHETVRTRDACANTCLDVCRSRRPCTR